MYSKCMFICSLNNKYVLIIIKIDYLINNYIFIYKLYPINNVEMPRLPQIQFTI